VSTDDQRQHDRNRLAASLRSRREDLGLSRRNVADRSGLSYPYVSQLENGDREPSLDALGRLAAALATSTEDLLAGRTDLSSDALLTPDTRPSATTTTARRRLAAPMAARAGESASAEPMGGAPMVGAPAGAAPAAAGPAPATWHANPSFAAAPTRAAAGGRSAPSRREEASAVVDAAYQTLLALTPDQRLDAAGALLARCVRDATPPA